MTQKNDDIFRLRELAITREAARVDVKDSLSETRTSAKPANLIKRAKTNSQRKLEKRGREIVETVKSRPAISASVVAAAALAVFRKPITKFVSGRLNSGAAGTDNSLE